MLLLSKLINPYFRAASLIHESVDKWQVTFVLQKSQIMSTSKKEESKHPLPDIQYHHCRCFEVHLWPKIWWTSHIYTLATRAGQRQGTLWQVTHLLTPQGQCNKAQVSNVLECALLAWVSAAPIHVESLTLFSTKIHLIGTLQPSSFPPTRPQHLPSTNIHGCYLPRPPQLSFPIHVLYHHEDLE